MTNADYWYRPLFAAALLLSFTLTELAGAAPAEVAPPASDVDTDPFYEPVVPLTPRHPRNEQQADKVTSAALFAHGRMLLQRDRHAEALREFQRAWRCSPESAAILDDVIQLAFQLRRSDMGARYAVIASELNPDDPILTRRLAEHLVDQGELRRGLKLYELAARPDDPPEGPVSEAKVVREIGRLSLLTGQYEKAAQAFDKLLDAIDHPETSKLTPDVIGEVVGKPELIYRLMAESYLLADRYDDAEKLFRRANDAAKDEPELAYRLARAEQKRGKTGKALRQLDAFFAAKVVPNDANPYRLLEELLKEKHKQDAEQVQGLLIERLESLWQDDPANVALGGFLAQRLLAADELDKAEETFSKLEEVSPSLEWDQGLIDAQRKRGDPVKLIKALGAAVAKTNSMAAFESAQQRILDDKELTKQVLKSGRQLLADDAFQPGDALALAYFALAAKDNEAADQFFAKAIETEDDAAGRNEILGSWALELFTAERLSEARQVFQQALEVAKSDEEKARINYFLSAVLELDGKTDAAVKAAKLAAELAPQVSSFETRPAWVLYHAKRYEAARDAYTVFVDKHQDDFSTSDIRDEIREARMILSNICVHLKDMPQSEEWLELVLDEFPEDVGAMNDLGYLWADQGKHLYRSLMMTRKAVEAEPENVAYLDSVGWAHYRLGEYDAAIEHLKKAVAGDEPDGVILDHLGDVYSAAGKRNLALETWRRAVTAFEREKNAEMKAKTTAKIEQKPK